ncbi:MULTISPECIES: type VII secretion integral membrane protein EccD [unclassified Mycobacterium]|uniref:type VII secretion integral membrane protein EccD n=1 Tax=unclassified Mycobacterium TaxID=2642494 RepID=UPI0029C6251A|nr:MULTISPECIES: type VII secretion integral membrane protein EccD [unclassified Mycobacterium]
MCRISIQTDFDGGRTIDLAVSAHTPVGALLPAVIDVLGPRSTPDAVHGWRLDRAAGTPLDESLSLMDNGVRDGDLLVLTTTHAPVLPPVDMGPAHTAASAGSSAAPSTESLAEWATTWAALAATVALTWTGAVTGGIAHLIVAACGTGAVCWTALVRHSAAVAVAGCALAGATGFLAVPGGPGAANVFLSATAVFAVALVMLRLAGRPSEALIATASGTALVGATMGCAMFTALPVGSVGAILATGALGLLSVAPWLSSMVTGLGPRCESEVPDAVEARARSGHATLTGVVIGCAVAVAAGSILVALGCVRAGTPPIAGGVFGFVAGLVLVLRGRTHVDRSRRAALLAGGLFCATSAFAIVCAHAPERVAWATLVLMAVGLGTLRHSGATPFSSRAADLLDYVTLAAVVPLACWVIGVYGLARDWQLT